MSDEYRTDDLAARILADYFDLDALDLVGALELLGTLGSWGSAEWTVLAGEDLNPEWRLAVVTEVAWLMLHHAVD